MISPATSTPCRVGSRIARAGKNRAIVVVLFGVLTSAAGLTGCNHSAGAESETPVLETGPQERVFGPGFSTARPAGYRVATSEDRADHRIARVLDAGGIAFIDSGDPERSNVFVLPGGTPFPTTPDEAFCQDMAAAFQRQGNGGDLSLALRQDLGEGGCSVSFRSRNGEGERRHTGLFFAARGQTWQLQSTRPDAQTDPRLEVALEIIIREWKFEPLPDAETLAFSVAVPPHFYEAADVAAQEARARGGVLWVAEKAAARGAIVASISITPAVGAKVPVTEATCRVEMEALEKTMRGVDVIAHTALGRSTCRAQGSDPEAPERQLSTTLVDVDGTPVWILCRFHVVDDDAAEACEALSEALRPSTFATMAPGA